MHGSLLTLLSFFVIFISCCSHSRVFGKTLLHVFHISYIIAVLNGILPFSDSANTCTQETIETKYSFVGWWRINFPVLAIIITILLKCATHAQMFSRTLAHGNSKVEIRQKTEEVGKHKIVNMKDNNYNYYYYYYDSVFDKWSFRQKKEISLHKKGKYHWVLLSGMCNSCTSVIPCKYLRMGTARMEKVKDTEEEGK